MKKKILASMLRAFADSIENDTCGLSTDDMLSILHQAVNNSNCDHADINALLEGYGILADRLDKLEQSKPPTKIIPIKKK